MQTHVRVEAHPGQAYLCPTASLTVHITATSRHDARSLRFLQDSQQTQCAAGSANRQCYESNGGLVRRRYHSAMPDCRPLRKPPQHDQAIVWRKACATEWRRESVAPSTTPVKPFPTSTNLTIVRLPGENLRSDILGRTWSREAMRRNATAQAYGIPVSGWQSNGTEFE